jgi:hypothetical protein
MENNMMMNYGYNNWQQQPYAGAPMQQQVMYQNYDPNMFGYNPMAYGSAPMPVNNNALTPEEIQTLKNSRPASAISLAVDHNDVLKSMCCHNENHRDIVVPLNDGSGNVWCPICKESWNPDMKSKEEVQELVTLLIDQMQNAKWVGDLPTELVRDLYTVIPLLKKYPDIHEYAMNTFNKYYSNRGMYNAQDASIYGMYNSLFGPGTPQTGYMNQPVNYGGYYGQGQQQPIMQQQPVYNQAPQGYMPQAAMNPMNNPMQTPYGVNPGAPNQQFVQQANNMMQGTVYANGQVMGGQPQMVQQPVVYGTPNVQQNQQVAQAQAQNAGPMAGPKPETAVTPQSDGSVKSTTKIEL